MTSKNRNTLIMLVLAIPIAFIWFNLTGSSKLTDQAIGVLPGRGQEPPWWQDVSIVQSPNKETYVIPGDVLFESASSTITPAGNSILLAMLPSLRGAIFITVAGCTDSRGGVDSPYNLNLSKQRANASVVILERGGLSPSLFHILAWADTHPAVTSPGLDSATVDSLNRRIIVIVTKHVHANA